MTLWTAAKIRAYDRINPRSLPPDACLAALNILLNEGFTFWDFNNDVLPNVYNYYIEAQRTIDFALGIKYED